MTNVWTSAGAATGIGEAQAQSVTYGDDLRRALEDLDLRTLRRLWSRVAPGLPQPADDGEALVTAHYARTQTRSIRFLLRAYSHAWLIDHGLPSGLPDRLRPRAQQLCPVTVTSVGMAMGTRHEWLKEPTLIVREAMENAVLDVYADGKADDIPRLKRRMFEVRDITRKKLFGSTKWRQIIAR